MSAHRNNDERTRIPSGWQSATAPVADQRQRSEALSSKRHTGRGRSNSSARSHRMDSMPNRISAMIAFTLALLAAQEHATAQSLDTSGLKLEAKIALGNVSGRIDHMAMDLARQRLF